MTYVQGQRAKLSTVVRGEDGQPADATVVLTMTAPDGTVSTPAVNHDGIGAYSASVTFDQSGDWLRVWMASGTVVAPDVDQIHVIAPTLRLVGLVEVKEHGNITSTASDRELLDFIGTAQQMIEELVGATVPQTFTQGWSVPFRDRCRTYPVLWFDHGPVLSINSITEYGNVVDPSLYLLNDDGSVVRTDGRGWYADTAAPLSVIYRAGRAPIPEGIRWAGKELTIHLWRSTQAQRGGRARGDIGDAAVAAGFGMPNRVRDALAPFLLAPVVA